MRDKSILVRIEKAVSEKDMTDINKGHIYSFGYIKLIYLERGCRETGQAKQCSERNCRFAIYPLRL